MPQTLHTESPLSIKPPFLKKFIFVLFGSCSLGFTDIDVDPEKREYKTPAPNVVTELRFNEGTGTTTADGSGNGHNGTLTGGPTWVAGKYGQGVNLDGTNDYVSIADHNNFTLDPAQSYTWSAWVKNNNFNEWSTVWSQTIDNSNFFYFYAHTSASDPDGGPVTNGISVYWYGNGGTNKVGIHTNNNVLTAGQWSYVTVTYNGSLAQASRFTIYVNGADVTNRSDVASSGTLTTLNPTNIRIGSNQPFGEYLNGAVDEVRYYRRLLSVAEIQSDMNTGNAPDTESPTVNITAPAAGNVSGTVSITANALDNVGIAGVQFLLDGVNLGTEDLSSPYSFSWNTTTVANGSHSLTAVARDASGNTTTSAAIAVNVNNIIDNEGPTVSITAPAAGNVSGTVNITADAADNIGVAGVQFLLDGANLGAEDTSPPYSFSWNSVATLNGSHTLTARARDAAGNSNLSSAIIVNVNNTNLVAAYGFNENAGTTLTDNSGNNNHGTLAGGPVWSGSGRFGAALLFDGTNDLVNIPDANSLDLTNGMTLEAWVNASNLTGYKTIICKENTASNLAYALSPNNSTSGAANQRPTSRIRIGANTRTVTGAAKLALNTWTHLASTYDGTMLRLFVNGTQVATFATTGNITATTDLLRIGGSPALGTQYFAGLIDEVRIYNRALSQAEIQTDMNTPIAADLTAPAVNLTAPAAGEVSGTVNLTANASDNSSVTGVQFLLDGENLGAEDLTAPYSFSWNTVGVPNGSHTLSARARDAAGNTTTATDVVVTVNNDTQAPTVSITAPAGGQVAGTIIISADAADNTGVAGVQFLVDGSAAGAEDITAPYSISWNTATIADGSHTITARARDAAGNNTISAGVIVSVLNNPPDTEFPVVAITAPAAGNVSGTISVSANAADNTAVIGVQFQLDGVNLNTEDLTAPYSISWNTSGAANGTHTLTAKARDAAGNVTTSAEVIVNVNNVVDSELPLVALTAPGTGTVSGTINVTADASDNVGVTGVQFLLNGANLGAEDLTAPYSVSWNTLTSANGSYTLTARARDAAGNTKLSTGVAVTVTNNINLIAGLHFNEGTGTAAADISGNNHNGTLTGGPAWIAGKYGQGINLDGSNDYVNIADHNNFTLDPAQSYTWSGWIRNTNFNEWGTVWSQTVDNSNFFYFYAHTSASDPDGGPVTNGISVYWYGNGGSNKVALHSNNNVLTAGQWSFVAITYNGTLAQNNRFSIYVNGTDVTNRTDIASSGTLATLNPTNIRIGSNQPFGEYLNGGLDEFRFYKRLLTQTEIQTDMNTPVGVDNTAPVISLTSPANGSNVSGTVNVNATATDNFGVSGVQFLLDGANLGAEDVTAPYTVPWNTETATAGSHTLAARARDAAGNITTTPSITVTIAPDFSFTLLTPSRNVESSGSIDYRLNVSYLNGFTSSNVQLSVSGLPANTTGNYLFNPMSHQGETQLFINTTNAALGSYTITLTAVAEGITHTQTGTLNITAAADFSLAASPSIQNVSRGGSTTYTINVNETNDYLNPVALSITGLPAGVTASFNPASPVPAATSTLTVTTSGSTPTGTFNLTVQGTSGAVTKTIPISMTVSDAAAVWTVSTIGSTGVPNNTVRVGKIRQDNIERVYIGTIATGRMLEYTWTGSSWAGPVDIGGSPSSAEIHDCNIGSGRGDGVERLYAASYDFNIYEFWHDASGWHQVTVGNVGNNLGMHMDIGDGRNDGVTRLYAASTQQLYEFTWNGTSWTRVLIGNTPGAHGVAVGKGRNDGKNYVYISSISSGNFEARFNNAAGTWTIAGMGDNWDTRGVGLGVGRNDGITRVYSAVYDGVMREFTWTGTAWTFVDLPSSGTQNIHAYVVPGRNDGINRLYTDNGNGKVWEYSWTGTAWKLYEMGGGTEYMYGLHFGMGRNDGQIRFYSTDRGTVNRVYEFSWVVPPPIVIRKPEESDYVRVQNDDRGQPQGWETGSPEDK